MNMKPQPKSSVLYLRDFPRDVKKRLRHAAVEAGQDLKDFVPAMCIIGLDVIEAKKKSER